MVVGSVGSGKSSLISALLGELPRTEGSLKLNGSLAYAAQEAFIFNSTVRENIIFGKPFEMQKYRAVLEASALVSDLAQFTAGDQTEIGERGVNLSGGQKQRIAIARALYADADIILLDDPLSAVDAHVSKHLFEKAIQGMLNDKLVVLATNQLQYLPFATEIIFLQGNEMVAKGKFADLIKSNAAFADQMSKYGVMSGDKKEVEAKKEEVKPVQQQAQQKASENSGLLIKDEEKQSGLIGPEVYSYYIKKGGVASFVIMLLFVAGTTGARITGSWWISQWTSMTQPGEVPLTYNQCKLFNYFVRTLLIIALRYWHIWWSYRC
jgi:ABC-type multidrug transport system ATPase subunit